MATDYDIGDLVRFSATFTDTAGTVTDPTVITCAVKIPVGTVTTYTYGTDIELVRDSLGIFHLDYSPLTEGLYTYRFKGTGACQTAEEKRFYIRPLQTV